MVAAYMIFIIKTVFIFKKIMVISNSLQKKSNNLSVVDTITYGLQVTALCL